MTQRSGKEVRRALAAALITFCAAGLVGAGGVHAQPKAPAPPARAPLRSFAELPDWSGIWECADRMAGLIFDASTLKPGDNGLTARDYPPYRPDWEARYDAFLDRVVKTGKYVDPLNLALPPGFPRFVSLPRGYQFVLRPEQVWMTHERPDVRNIYTDGRGHPPDDELLPTWGGHSIGHWEGDTLVIDTVGMKPGVPLDRTGMVLSEMAHVVEHMRKVGPDLIEDRVTIDDPVAFTRPWTVVRGYRRIKDPNATMEDVPSLENNRNPVVNGQTQIILNSNYDPAKPYPAEVQPYAAM